MTDFFDGYHNADNLIDILHSGKLRDIFFVDNTNDFAIIATFDDQFPRLIDTFKSKKQADNLFWDIGYYCKQRGLL